MRDVSPRDFPWKRSRSGFAVFVFCSLLLGNSILRLILLLKFGLKRPLGIGEVAQLFLIGFHQDFLVAMVYTLPLLFWLWIIRDRWFGKLWHRVIFLGMTFLLGTLQVFLWFVEFYYFKEFHSRFDDVSVNYLAAPHEVVGNIWESYPVVLIIGICVVICLVWMGIAFRYFRQMWFQPLSASTRFFHFMLALIFSFGLWLSLNPSAQLYPRLRLASTDMDTLFNWVRLRTVGTQFSEIRTLNEIANNGTISFLNAALTRDLDYSAYYKTMDKEAAYRRVRRLLAEPDATFLEPGNSIVRRMAGDPSRPKLNVVILIEESLGSEFWGCLGRPQTLTPNMDRLATTEGLLFTNIYATGNRTVRGFEGVLSGFPPLPGDSIVKRDRSENIETIARVLKRDGYSSVFLYGGRGVFDNMRYYATHNGWDRFIEQKDFPHPHFTTIWGVCDEDVYARGIEEFRKLNDAGKPFLGTIMSVSNHKPYTYPRGRIPDDPDHPRNRKKAVKYADWCLGQFFAAAQKEAFWTNTIFVVVADHGARVYGSQDIPIHSYEIPLVILGPAVVKKPRRIGQLGCSLDVPSTVLGLIGRPYLSSFFGRDLLREKPGEGRVFIQHNRDIGIMEHDRLAVLGLQKTEEFYEGDPKVASMKPLLDPTPSDREIEKDAIATYQVADDLYMTRRYRIDGVTFAQTPQSKPVQPVSKQASRPPASGPARVPPKPGES